MPSFSREHYQRVIALLPVPRGRFVALITTWGLPFTATLACLYLLGGFSKSGVRGNSLASKYQSRAYGGSTPKGGIFANSTSAGMRGRTPLLYKTTAVAVASFIMIAVYKKRLAVRYLKFDLQKLLKATVTAVSSEGARYCTRGLKSREELNNKAYLLTMGNGSEVFAKLPNPIAGPACYTTAAEVATRESGPLEFVEAMATNEMRFIKTYARPRMIHHRSSTEPELPEEVLGLLNQYLQLTPAMVPPLGTDDTHSPTLWLHLDDVFVDPESNQITRIIDWQSAAVMPFFIYQCGISGMFQYPGTIADSWPLTEFPKDYDKLIQSEKAKIDSDRRSDTCHKYYKAETKSQNSRHWAALQLDNANVRTEPLRLVVNVWEDHDIFFLRRDLLSFVEQWKDLYPKSDVCPVSFKPSMARRDDN
ncbi:uncharacterized protein RAG0_14757 [Rhynchosporium agropyri]|uniref:Aminoglycoside phosphotransferase domain-containing protein n=1 Tax=Rhynchosporium agropyri TaxID=914238 RepID=A0A1E1LI90_9HELO|nr:uncharacterized protein RAG0_14757 [Rhynchosporium agropyri]